MNWFEKHLLQLTYLADLLGRFLPFVLTAAIILTFFLVQSYGRRLSRMEYFLDRIDNHLAEITYFIKDYQRKSSGQEPAEQEPEKQPDPDLAGRQ